MAATTPLIERRFETVARVSEINKKLYETFLQPSVRALSTPATAAFLREMHPNRVSFRAFSDRNPLMPPIAAAAEKVRANRHAVDEDNPFLAYERMASSWIVTSLEIFAKWREAMTEATFLTVYGAPALQAAVGLGAPGRRDCRHAHDRAWRGRLPLLDASAWRAAGRSKRACARFFTYRRARAPTSGISTPSRRCA